MMPDRFTDQSERTVYFNQRAPAARHFLLAKQLVRHDQKKQVRTNVTHQALKLSTAVQAILQGREFAQNASVIVVSDRSEIVRIIFGKERINGAQSGVVDTEMFFEHLTASVDRTEPLARRSTAAIVAAQIGAALVCIRKSQSLPVV